MNTLPFDKILVDRVNTLPNDKILVDRVNTLPNDKIIVDRVNTLPFDKILVDIVHTLPNDKILVGRVYMCVCLIQLYQHNTRYHIDSSTLHKCGGAQWLFTGCSEYKTF